MPKRTAKVLAPPIQKVQKTLVTKFTVVKEVTVVRVLTRFIALLVFIVLTKVTGSRVCGFTEPRSRQ